MTTPSPSALGEAQAVRRERAALQRKLAETRPPGAAIGSGLAVLAAPALRVACMSVRELLALYGVGPIRARDVLEATRIDPATSLAELTGARRRRGGARQVGASAARDVAGDVPASGGATDEKESP